MANHCVYSTCQICGGEFCVRGCGHTCECGMQIAPNKERKRSLRPPLSEKEIEDMKKKFEREKNGK